MYIAVKKGIILAKFQILHIKVLVFFFNFVESKRKFQNMSENFFHTLFQEKKHILGISLAL